MSKVVGFVIGAALIVVGLTVPGMQGLIIQGAAMIVSQAVVDLTAPKVPARQAAEMTLQLGEQPRVLLVGETANPGSMVDGFNYGGKYGTDWECLIIRLADHPCHSLTGFYVNDEWNLYTGDGLVGRYDDQLEIYFRSNTSTQPLPSRVTDNGPGWTSADLGKSGCDVVVCYKADKDKDKHPGWPGGRPHFLFVVKGALCYDPRKDSTVAGGSGAHRDNDSTTWEWSENAAICRYKWVRGVYADDDVSDQSKLLIGRGLSAAEAPPENIIAPANLCDEVAAAVMPFDVRAPKPPGFDHLWGVTYSPDFTKLLAHALGNYNIWDVPTRSLIASGTLDTDSGGDDDDFTGFSKNGTIYVCNNTGILTSSVFAITDNGRSAAQFVFDNPHEQDCCVVRVDGAGTEHICTIPTPSIRKFYVDGVEFDPDTTGHTWAPTCFCSDAYGDIWAIGARSVTATTEVCLWRVVNHSGRSVANFATFTIPSVTNPAPAATHYAADSQWVVLVNAATLYAIDDTTFAIKNSVAFATNGYNCPKQFANLRPGATSIWMKWSGLIAEVSLSTLGTLRTVDHADWTSSEDADGVLYDSINDALIGASALGTHLIWRFLDRHGGYRVAGPIYSNQDFIDVETMFATATGGNTITHEGSVELEPGQAKSVVVTITDDDVLSGSQVSWNHGVLGEGDAEWVNGVIGRYIEPDLQWQDHGTPIARDTADITADGRPREASITMRLVRYLAQAQRVVEINRRLGRLLGRASLKLGPRHCELEAGDWISWQSARFGFTKTFRIDAHQIDEKWQNTVKLREISGSVYADDAVLPVDQSHPTTSPPPPDVGAPSATDWTLSPTTLVSSGASVPALVVTGAVPSNENVGSIIVEYWKNDGVTTPPTTAAPDGVPWTMVGTYPSDATSIQIGSLTGAATYYVALTYVVSGIPGDRLVLGPQTIADLDVSNQLHLTIDVVAGTTYTIAASDAWHHKRFTNAGAIAVTVPTNASAAYPIGGRTRLTQAGAGQITLAPALGVTLNSRDAALKSAAQLAVFEIEKVGADEWDVLGDVTA